MVADQVHQALSQQGERAGRAHLTFADLGEHLQVQVPHQPVVFIEALVERFRAQFLQQREQLALLRLVVEAQHFVDPLGPTVHFLPVQGRERIGHAGETVLGLFVGGVPVGRGQVAGADQLWGGVGHECLQI